MSDRTELATLATSLEELVDRVADLAENLAGQAREDLGPDLFEVERTLTTASRRLSRLAETLPG